MKKDSKAEVIAYEDYIKSGGESQAREKGLLRLEGKEYIVKDGDVMHLNLQTDEDYSAIFLQAGKAVSLYKGSNDHKKSLEIA